jgi:outer membrane lipoprotein-sorting protein
MMGQASIADITSILFYPNYNVESHKATKQGYVLTLIAKNKTVAYSKIMLSIDKQGMPTRAEFYALSGRLLKTMEFSGVKSIGGYERPTQMKIVDEINNNLQTTVIFKTMEAKKFKESTFTKENLKRISALQIP